MFHENICIVISSFFHQNTTENFPSTFPTGVCQKFIPPKKTPQKTVAPLLVQGPHHIVLMRWGFSSTPLKATASPENGTHFNRRFLPFEIFRLNLQGPFWKTWGDLWFHEHSRLIFAQVKVAPGFRVCLWFGIDRFLFKSLFFKIDNTFFFWEKKQRKNLGGGWTNPFEKYARQIGSSNPNFSGWKFQTCLQPPPPRNLWIYES